MDSATPVDSMTISMTTRVCSLACNKWSEWTNTYVRRNSVEELDTAKTKRDHSRVVVCHQLNTESKIRWWAWGLCLNPE